MATTLKLFDWLVGVLAIGLIGSTLGLPSVAILLLIFLSGCYVGTSKKTQ